jgi:hypothetical protein
VTGRRKLVIALTVLAFLGATAWVSWQQWGRYDVSRDGPLVVADADWFDFTHSGFLALLGGELTIEGDCAYLGDQAVLWPDGTEWLPDERAVRLPSGAIAHEGDVVNGGGGAFHIDRAMTARLFVGCARRGEEISVFNLHEELEVDQR